MRVIVSKNSIQGAMSVPSSKSHTIRAVVIATLANGISVIKNPLPSRDGLAALNAAQMFGAKCTVEKDQWTIEGGNLTVPDNVIDVDNSGTTLYMMTAVAALLGDTTVFTGDASIRQRPIRPMLDALKQLGATGFTTRSEVASPPFIVTGPIKAGAVKVKGSPSQYISSLLLVAPMCCGTTRIESDNVTETPYIDMTIEWMRRCGIVLDYDADNYRYFEIKGKQEYNNFTQSIPSDWSAVAFPLAAGLSEGSKLTINHLDFHDQQGDSKIVDMLIDMGASIDIDEAGQKLTVTGGKPLKGITIDCADTPDTLPMLSVIGAVAEGKTILKNVGGVRAKETDRVAVMEQELGKMGVKVESDFDTMTIHGGQTLKGALVESHGDHRVAMALSVAGLFAEGETVVEDAECVDVSFPNFYESLNRLGAQIKLID